MKTKTEIEIKICEIENEISKLKNMDGENSEVWFRVILHEYSIDMLKWVLGEHSLSTSNNLENS